MSSKTGYVKIAIIGLKVLAAVVGGVALYAGLNKLTDAEKENYNHTIRNSLLNNEYKFERKRGLYGTSINDGPHGFCP